MCALLQKGWERALELFLCAGMAGAPASVEVCLTLMAIFGEARATLETAQLLHEFMHLVRPQLCNELLEYYSCRDRKNTAEVLGPVQLYRHIRSCCCCRCRAWQICVCLNVQVEASDPCLKPKENT